MIFIYRSQRSVEALSEFVQKQLDSSIVEVHNAEELKQKLDPEKRNVIAYFSQLSGPEYENLKKVSSILREECSFFVATGPDFNDKLASGPSVSFRKANVPEESPLVGTMQDFNLLKQWVSDKCIPLVREITFENAEELTEEGLPFLILFRHPDDKESERIFTEAVIREIPDQKTAVNCLVADGKKFAHPLHHLGKRESDLPVIAIDSFRHMYLFPNTEDMKVQGRLRQFVLDLHSGKLHREFHHGPDPVQQVTDAMDTQTTKTVRYPILSVMSCLKIDFHACLSVYYLQYVTIFLIMAESDSFVLGTN
ncbi:unnamed protein product [Cylicostephanus goldi]|uniref:Thioredoxin domain-containing protein n=1 Tax=Cylicostephanus goldi TaxID=71465 RepID=A0A3P6RBE1_CYLGO|nr:unnamed protein product [Cylicostephanus goldi]